MLRMQRSHTLLASALIEFHSRDFRLYGILPSEAMASLRRALSIQNIPNGSPFAVPSGAGYGSASVSPSMSPTGLNSPTAAASPAEAYHNKVAALTPSFFSWLRTFSWFRTVKLGGPEKSKFKGSSFRKSVSLVFLCFFVGLVFGLTPLSWYHARREFFLESFNNPDLDMPGEPHFATGDETTIPGKASHRQPGAFKWSLGSTTGVRKEWTVPLKPLLIVTPTYNRPLQAYYMTRLAHTLKLVPPPLLWIVVEEYCQSADTIQLLRTTGLMYRHISCNATTTDIKDRGISQRNAALAHIEQHQLDGIVYFADDDNVYTMELFEQLREVKRFGTWPVAFLVPGKAKAVLEGPVCKEHEVIGWHTNEKSKRLRRFHVDMAGFAFNSTILWDPQRWGRWIRDPIRQLVVKEGFQETTFIEQLVEDESQMEGLPSGCSKVMVWHLHFETPGLPYPAGWVLKDHLPTVISVYGPSA